MRLLITGAAGTLGSTLASSLNNAGHTIIATSRNGGENLYPCDLVDTSSVEKLFGEQPIDLVIHCAAKINVEACEAFPHLAVQNNTLATINLAKGAADKNIPLWFISSDQVFDGYKDGFYHPDAATNPLNWYARSKVWAELACLTLSPQHKIIRTNYLSTHHGFLAWALSSLKNGDAITAYNNLWFNPLSIDDLISCIQQLLALATQTRIIHLASRDAITKGELILQLAKALGFSSNNITSLAFTPNAAPYRPLNMRLDVSSTELKLGLKMPTIKDLINKIIQETKHE